MNTITIPEKLNGRGEPIMFTGRRAGVMFDGNVGYAPTLSEAQRFNFERWGYTVEGEDEEETPTAKRARSRRGRKSTAGDDTGGENDNPTE